MKIKTPHLTLVVLSSSKLFNVVFLCSFFYFTTATAQEPISIGIVPNEQECHTPDISFKEAQQLPYFGKPNYIDNFIDSLQNATRVSRVESSVWRIPICFWILTTGN